MRQHIVYSVIFLTATFFTCRNNGTEPPSSEIRLIAEDVSATEVWLRVKTAPSLKPRMLTLTRNDQIIFATHILSLDTLLYNDSLLPNHSYNYKATLTGANPFSVFTASLTSTTLDTTSHNFTFEIDTLGDGASSNLRDVFIINDTCVWAVGEINVLDSTGQFRNPPYNIAHWNGSRWHLESLKFRFEFGEAYSQAVTVFAFGVDNLLVSSGSSVMHWNGRQWNNFPFLYLGGTSIGNIYKFWGTSLDDFYGVGLNGSALHWVSNSWQKIETGTTLPIQDIWGTVDPRTGSQQILAVATRNYPLDRAILSLQGNTAMQISAYPIQYELFGVWFVTNRHYYVVGDGIYEKKSLSDSAWQNNPLDITRYATTMIRGNRLNDVFVVGAFGEVLHYNGVTWKSYRDQTGLANGSYASVSLKGNLVVAVGQIDNKAVAVIGRR